MVKKRPSADEEFDALDDVTPQEVSQYTEELKGLPQYHLNGMTISPRERYLMMHDALKLRGKEWVVTNPDLYRKVDRLEMARIKEPFTPPPNFFKEMHSKFPLKKMPQ